MSTDDKTKQWYNENAAGYTAHVRNPDESIYHAYYEKPAMYSLLPNLQNKRVISLGCGSGEDSHYLKQQGANESVGIDISSELITIATNSHPECEFQVMDMEHLKFEDNSFDFAYSSLAIHYIEKWNKVFSEVYRILKPNSHFLFSCAHPVRTAMVVTENSVNQEVRQLAIIKEKNPRKNIIIGDYLSKRKLSDGLGNLADVTTWHKSLSEIMSEVTDTGFLVEQIIEPKPLEEMQSVSERDYIRLNKIPEFIIFKLIKL